MASFSFIFVVLNNRYNFSTNKCVNCLSSIWTQAHYTITPRSGLLPFLDYIAFMRISNFVENYISAKNYFYIDCSICDE